jgi:predicted phosphodiesterase
VRLAIVSDIHANLPALEVVLADAQRVGVDQLWCLGDVVGYGAHPDECASLIAERSALCLVGNHDLAVLGELDDSAFSPAAAAAVRWTRETARPETIEFLRGLEPAEESREVALYHASPRDPIWEYVLWPDQAAECIAVQAARVSLIGHSHVALFFVMAEDGDRGGPDQAIELEDVAKCAQAVAGTRLDLSEGRWLINPGSVGQPRDGDPRAAWMVLDTEAWTAVWRRTVYDVAGAQSAIRAARLPDSLAERLEYGQ